MRGSRRALVLLVAAALIAGCGAGEKLTRKERGDRAFAQRNWPEAIEQYQIYLEEGFGAEDAMLSQFMLARAYFENEDYPTAAVEFEIFQRDYPRSDSLLAAAYYETRCWVEQSPPFDRDASLTERAIRMLENFLLDHPGSEYEARARADILRLRDKLARKKFASAQLYAKLGKTEAARIYYEILLRDYPESRYWERGAVELVAIHIAAGRRVEAQRLAARIAAERPGSPEAQRAARLVGGN